MSHIARLEEEKEKWKIYFVSSIKADPVGKSEAIAVRLLDEIESTLKRREIQTLQLKVKENILEKAEEFRVEGIQKKLDEELLFSKGNTEEMLQYITNPGECVKKEFDQMWSRVYESQKIWFSQEFARKMRSEYNLLKKHALNLSVFQKKQQEDMNTKDILQNEEGGAVYEKTNRGNATFHFFIDSCCGEKATDWVFDSWKISNISEIPTWGDLHFLNGVLPDTVEIPLLDIFLKKVIWYSDKKKTGLQDRFDIVDLGLIDLYNEWKGKSIGCSEKCPTCGRKCDQPNEDPQHTHACTLGHQLRAMAGVMVEGNLPSFQTCDELEDSHDIRVRNRWETWKDVKGKYPKWEFHYFPNAEEKLEVVRSFRRCWEHHGKEIVDLFKQVNMVYSPLKPRDLHMIFVLSEENLRAREDVWETLMKNKKAGGQFFSLIFSNKTTQTLVVREKLVSSIGKRMDLDMSDLRIEKGVALLLVESERTYLRQQLWIVSGPRWPSLEITKLHDVEERVVTFLKLRSLKTTDCEETLAWLGRFQPGVDIETYYKGFSCYDMKGASKHAERLTMEEVGQLGEFSEEDCTREAKAKKILSNKQNGWEYEVLELEQGASHSKIKLALKKLRKYLHPDKMASSLRNFFSGGWGKKFLLQVH